MLLTFKNILITVLVDILVIMSNFFCYADLSQMVIIVITLSFTVLVCLFEIDDYILRRYKRGTRKNV